MSFAALTLGITIALAASAKVRGADAELAEIASISGAARDDEARLAAIVLGPAPAPGFARTLARERIAQDVQRALPGATITWTGSGACRIEAECDTIASGALGSCARAALRELFAARDVEMTLESAPADLVVPVASVSRELRAVLGSRELRGGSWSVGVQAWIDGEPYRTAWATYRVDLFERRHVLARDVRRGIEITAADLAEARVRVDGTEPALDASSLEGSIAQRDLARGATLSERDVARPRLVKSGDVVELLIAKGAVAARVAAYAAQDGRAGERIRVTTVDKRRELVATVVGRGSVEVDLGGTRASASKTP